MATLFNTKISATYPGLIKTIDNTALSATLKQLTDGSGTASGVFMNTAGDFKVNSILEFGSLKDTGENIIITKFVDAADGIANNNNDTSIPTSSAVKTYVDAVVTASDLDFLGDSNTGTPAVDLDSQNFSVLGTANEIVTSGANQILTIGLPNNVTISGTFTGATFAGQLNGTISSSTTATTQTAGDNSTKIATTAYVDTLDAASDLDFSGDSGTGDVNLNTQSLAITGTTNQIVTAASNQALSLSLPATVHRNLQGNVTGNVDGDLTGNVTATSVLVDGVTATTQASSDSSTKVATTAYVKGLDNASDLDITGDTGTGDVNLNTQTLNILGTTNEITTAVVNQTATISLPSTISVNVIGNVTGDLTGNADTATKWQTARDLSLTGQATGTLSNVDGTLAVSGAVTLDNNSVTGKVLTGLASPSASSVLATDSILEAFGKVQSQVNGLANGLRFIGSWDASSNSPVLSSGGGEAANGTTTSTLTNKLVDSSASFTSTVTVGDQVVNQVDGQIALVTNIDSNTTLSLDADIMLTSETYTIDNSPFITQGHYYVVSVGGTTSLNGINTWSVGDWVIAGANNEWTKLDHSQVDGTGTTGNIPKWSSTSVIADSIMAESGSVITVSGTLSTTTNLNSGSNFAVATDKFTANATTGNVAFPGDLAINTNKFTVNATSGNISVGGSGTFAGDVLIEDNIYLTDAGTARAKIQLNSSDRDNLDIKAVSLGSTMNFFTADTLALGLDSSQNATFAGDVSLTSGALSITADGSNAVTFTESGNGLLTIATPDDIILDAAGDIVIDAGADDIRFKNNGTEVGVINLASSNFTITSAVSNKDIIFGGNDGGTGITALTLDMSNGGSATFRDDIDLGGKLTQTGTGTNTFAGNVNIDGSPVVSGDTRAVLSIDENNTASAGRGGGLTFGRQGSVYGGIKTLQNTSSNDNATMYFQTIGGGSISNRMVIDELGNVGIGIDSPDTLLHVYNPDTNWGAYSVITLGTDVQGTNQAQLKYYRGANTETESFQLSVRGTTALTALYNGNVGIGTDSPDALLELKNSAPEIRITDSTDDSYTRLRYDGSAFLIEVDDASGANDSNFRIQVDGSEAMRIDSSGNVGIDEIDPSSKLSIGGNAITTLKPTVVISDTTNGASLALRGQSPILFFDGTAAGVPKILMDGQGIEFKTGTLDAQGDTHLKIDSSGNVGIGTDSPDYNLEIESASSPAIATKDTTNNVITKMFSANSQGFIGTESNHDLRIRTNNTDKITIQSGGNVGIGTDDPDYELQVGNGTATETINIKASNTNPSRIFFSDNDAIAQGRIHYEHGGDYMNFWTDNTERMRITSGGDVECTTDNAQNLGSAFLRWSTVYAANGVNTSDKTLKENIKECDLGIDFIDSLKPKSYNLKDLKEDNDAYGKKRYGLIAQDILETELKDSVFGKKDGEYGLSYNDLIAPMIKAIQELKAEVDKLKQECKCKN